MGKRIAIFSFSSLLLIIGFSFFLSPHAYAAPYADMDLDDKTRSIVFYYGMDTCFNGINSIKNSPVSEGVYDNNDSVTVGYFVDYEDGKMSCSDMVSEAKRLWYNNNLEAMLKDIGYKLEGNTWKLNGDVLKQIMPKIRSKVFNGQNPPSLSGSQKFILYNQALRGGCDLRNPSGDIKKMSDSEKATYTSNPGKYMLVNVIDGETVIEKYYQYTQPSEGGDGTGGVADRLTPIPVSTNGTPNILTQATCKELASGVGSNIDAYKNSPDKSKVDLENSLAKEGGDKATATCRIQGIGWIVCPISHHIAFLVDTVYQVIALALQAPPVYTFNTDNSATSIYRAWQLVRNIANIAFVIAFLIIIYSQITGAGISNYGLKKMLPKLIVGAVLINASFWICAALVDISNLLGYSMQRLFMGLYDEALDSSSWVAVLEVLLAGGAAGALAAGGVSIAIATGAGAALLWIALPMLLGAAIAVITALIVVSLRQAIIIILIVTAPIAIVLYMLPNTKKVFDKWKNMFISMLVFFPLFGLVFGGSQLAAGILIGASGDAPASSAGLLLLMGMLAQIAPLFLAPFIIRLGGGTLANIAGKIQGRAGGMTKGINKFARQKSMENFALGKSNLMRKNPYEKNRFGRRTLSGRVSGMMRTFDNNSRTRKLTIESNEAAREADWQENVAQNENLRGISMDSRSQKTRAESAQRIQDQQYTEDILKAGGNLYTAAGIDPGGEARVTAIATQKQHKVFDEAVAASKTTLTSTPVDGAPGSLRERTGDSNLNVEDRAAAAGTVGQRGGQTDIQNMIDDLGAMYRNASSDEERENISSITKQFFSDAGNKIPQSVTGQAKGEMGRGEFAGSFDDEILKSLDSGRYSGEIFASMHPKELARVAKTISDAYADSDSLTDDRLKQITALQKSISDYRTASVDQAKGLSQEYLDQFETVQKLGS